ncbi:hypothetical protein [Nonomuraea ceibae]|uniref:hypothetical protein n=1 Tax=Nonomuraea ceibae TaxID=1935170 RepID=UPI001C5D70CA|nr:hypothetical protein [Nonomuraea ceibae]
MVSLDGDEMSLHIATAAPDAGTTFSCVQVVVGFKGTPVSKIYNSWTDRTLTFPLPPGSFERYTMNADACGTGVKRTLDLRVFLHGRLVVRAGSTVDVRLPGIILFGDRSAPSGLSASWFVLEEDHGPFKAESVSERYVGPGLVWSATRDGPSYTWSSLPTQHGTFTEIPAEKAAGRSTFWSGLWIGLATSLFAWACEALWAARMSRRESTETLNSAHVAALVAQQVTRALAERSEAERRQALRDRRMRRNVVWWARKLMR